MNLEEEQRLMRERNIRKKQGIPAVKTPIKGIKPVENLGYVDQKSADLHYHERVLSKSERRKELLAELRHPSSESLAVKLDLKQRAVELKGGCCSLCGYARCVRALEFHHLERHNKSFTISKFIGDAVGHFLLGEGLSPDNIEKIWETVAWELRKCVLLCSNCHREVEAGVTELKGINGS